MNPHFFPRGKIHGGRKCARQQIGACSEDSMEFSEMLAQECDDEFCFDDSMEDCSDL